MVFLSFFSKKMDIYDIVFNSMLSILFVSLALIILFGKGDKLIAGYNSANEEERRKYDIRRLRLVTGVALILVAAEIWIMAAVGDDVRRIVITIIAILFVAIVAVILANTWCKRK